MNDGPGGFLLSLIYNILGELQIERAGSREFQ